MTGEHDVGAATPEIIGVAAMAGIDATDDEPHGFGVRDPQAFHHLEEVGVAF